MASLHAPAHFHFHAPQWFSIIGMVLGVILFPLMILGTLFLVVKAIVGM